MSNVVIDSNYNTASLQILSLTLCWIKKKKKEKKKRNKRTQKPDSPSHTEPQKSQPWSNVFQHDVCWQQDAAIPNIRSCSDCSPKGESFSVCPSLFRKLQHAWRSWYGWAAKTHCGTDLFFLLQAGSQEQRRKFCICTLFLKKSSLFCMLAAVHNYEFMIHNYGS